MTRYIFAAALLLSTAAYSQEGPAPTQALIALSARTATPPPASSIVLRVDNRPTPLSALNPIPANAAQIAVLIDDGLRTSVGRELNTLKAFVSSLPPGTEVFVGYMQNGRVSPASEGAGSFTTDHAAAAQGLRMPSGLPGSSASPYFCLSDFVKNWPDNAENQPAAQSTPQPTHKARFVLMITNGVDPYNGSTSIANQNSPYVDAAVQDAQRAGVPVYSIYFSDAGIGGGRASFSGQGYLNELADGTGGIAFYQGTGNPVSMDPFLKQFQVALSQTYLATFPADTGKKQVSLKVSTNLPKVKVRAPQYVRPGTIIVSQP